MPNADASVSTAGDLPLRVPTVVTDGGPWALHDQACPVCCKDYATLNLDNGVFEPCGSCQRMGWTTQQTRRSIWQNIFGRSR